MKESDCADFFFDTPLFNDFFGFSSEWPLGGGGSLTGTEAGAASVDGSSGDGSSGTGFKGVALQTASTGLLSSSAV